MTPNLILLKLSTTFFILTLVMAALSAVHDELQGRPLGTRVNVRFVAPFFILMILTGAAAGIVTVWTE